MSASAAATPAKPGGKKKLLILVGIGLLVLVGGGGAAAYLMGWLGGSGSEPVAGPHGAPASTAHGEAGEGDPSEEPGGGSEAAGHGGGEATGSVSSADAAFVDMPDIVVNLQPDGRRMRFLKLRLVLEVADKPAGEAIARLMPRVTDSFQVYLRALTVEEVQGSGGVQRLKEEMLARVNLALAPQRADDVLIKEMLVQ